MSSVIDNSAASRYELTVDSHIAYATYQLSGMTLSINYVFAPPALRGTGAAGRLMEGIMLHARENGLRIYPICSYAVSWMRRHPEHADLLAD